MLVCRTPPLLALTADELKAVCIALSSVMHRAASSLVNDCLPWEDFCCSLLREPRELSWPDADGGAPLKSLTFKFLWGACLSLGASWAAVMVGCA